MLQSHDRDISDDILEGGRQGWPAILSSLKSVLETGKPLAIKMQPPQRMLAALKAMGDRNAGLIVVPRLRDLSRCPSKLEVLVSSWSQQRCHRPRNQPTRGSLTTTESDCAKLAGKPCLELVAGVRVVRNPRRSSRTPPAARRTRSRAVAASAGCGSPRPSVARRSPSGFVSSPSPRLRDVEAELAQDARQQAGAAAAHADDKDEPLHREHRQRTTRSAAPPSSSEQNDRGTRRAPRRPAGPTAPRRAARHRCARPGPAPRS